MGKKQASENFSGMAALFYILIVVVVTWICQINPSIQFKWMNFILCKLYLKCHFLKEDHQNHQPPLSAPLVLDALPS